MPKGKPGKTPNQHIAIYLPSLHGGGAERAMVTLANGFAARGLRVDMVLAAAEGPYLAEVSPEVRIVDLKARRVLRSLPGLVRYLRMERPDAMLSAMNHANVIAVMARILAGVSFRLVISERVNLSSNNDTLRFRVLKCLMRWAYRKPDGIVAVSKGVADDLARTIGVPRERVSVIYNPVVTRELAEKAKEDPGHPWLRETFSSCVILGVGRLDAQKDFQTLIRAFHKVRANRDCRLVILGEGQLRQQLEGLVSGLGMRDCVDLPGFVDNPFAWMSRASLFVLSSAWEGLPNALIQAMACGTLVVSTDCPSGPYEILEGGKWGRLAPVGDVEVLADAIIAALTDEKPPDVIRRAQDFGVESAVDEYLDILQA